MRLTEERILAIFASIAALVVSSVFISVITNTMAEMKRLHHHRARKLSLARDFAQSRDISTELALRMKKYIYARCFVDELNAQDATSLTDLRVDTGNNASG